MVSLLGKIGGNYLEHPEEAEYSFATANYIRSEAVDPLNEIYRINSTVIRLCGQAQDQTSR